MGGVDLAAFIETTACHAPPRAGSPAPVGAFQFGQVHPTNVEAQTASRCFLVSFGHQRVSADVESSRNAGVEVRRLLGAWIRLVRPREDVAAADRQREEQKDQRHRHERDGRAGDRMTARDQRAVVIRCTATITTPAWVNAAKNNQFAWNARQARSGSTNIPAMKMRPPIPNRANARKRHRLQRLKDRHGSTPRSTSSAAETHSGSEGSADCFAASSCRSSRSSSRYLPAATGGAADRPPPEFRPPRRVRRAPRRRTHARFCQEQFTPVSLVLPCVSVGRSSSFPSADRADLVDDVPADPAPRRKRLYQASPATSRSG